MGPKSPKRCKTTVTATTVSTNTAKVQKQLEIEAKRLERARKKEEAEREKAVKKALAAAHKNIKPDECIKVFENFFYFATVGREEHNSLGDYEMHNIHQ